MDGLASLLAKNLIHQEEGLDGEPRFHFLETVHEYTSARLTESGEGEQIQRRHADFFVDQAVSSKSMIGDQNKIHWLIKIESDFENYLLAHDRIMLWEEDILRLTLVDGLSEFWSIIGHSIHGMSWAESALTIIHKAPLPFKGKSLRDSAAIMKSIYYEYKEGLELLNTCFANPISNLQTNLELPDVTGECSQHWKEILIIKKLWSIFISQLIYILNLAIKADLPDYGHHWVVTQH